MINRFYFTIKVLKDKIVDKWTKQIVNWLKTSLAIPLTKNEGFFFIFCKTFTCTCTSHNNYVKRKRPMHVIRKGIKSYIWVKKEKQYQLRNKRRSNTDRGFFFWSGLRYPAWQELRNCSKVHTYICRRLIKKNRYTCIIYGASFNASQLYPCITSSAGKAFHW